MPSFKFPKLQFLSQEIYEHTQLYIHVHIQLQTSLQNSIYNARPDWQKISRDIFIRISLEVYNKPGFHLQKHTQSRKVLYKGPYKLSYRNLPGAGIKNEEIDTGPHVTI